MNHDEPQNTEYQWTVDAHGNLIPIGEAFRHAKPDMYIPFLDGSVYKLRPYKAESDELIEVPGSIVDETINDIEIFLEAREKYHNQKFIHTAAYIFHGPTGSGKTSAALAVARKLIDEYDGMVLYFQNLEHGFHMLPEVCLRGPDRPVMVWLEDLERAAINYPEVDVSNFVSGGLQLSNVIYLATTNHFDVMQKSQAVLLRSGRFEEVLVDFPDAKMRQAYLKSKLDHEVIKSLGTTLEQIVDDTQNTGIANLRTLVRDLTCLGRDYKKAIDRLKSKTNTSTDNVL